jgi:RimJ/RimL family protein N-acetyltransferase
MILLSHHQYHLVDALLDKPSMNVLFAKSIIKRKVQGIVYADNTSDPHTVYLLHPYGMSLLLGDVNQVDFNKLFQSYLLNNGDVRKREEWMQVWPEEWNRQITLMAGNHLHRTAEGSPRHTPEKVELHTRVNFKFNRGKYHDFRTRLKTNETKVQRLDYSGYDMVKGSVVPKFFWDNASDFLKNGIGFSVMVNSEPVSTAFSSFLLGKQLELGIETNEKYRGEGLAGYACCALIDYCLNEGFEPVWACRLENTASLKLAQKLGFEPTYYLPYYKLNV